MTKTDQDREDFEAAARADGLAPETWDDEEKMYDDSDTQWMWQGWQDALAHERARAQGEPVAMPDDSFQARVDPWMQACFGPAISADRLERGDRLLEEVLELLQSGGYPADRVSALTGYVWSRPVGELRQEVGGVMVTLAAYCLAHGVDMHEAGETELARIWTKVEKIRAKQAAKPTGSALPQAWPVPPPDPKKDKVAIKPLEWMDESADGYVLFTASSAVGFFTYGVDRNGVAYHQAAGRGADHADAMTAKDAAEADHRRLVLLKAEEIGILATPPTAPVAATLGTDLAGEDPNECYEIGKRDGYEGAVQQIDILTGGSGEYRCCTNGDPERHAPNPQAMIRRIVERFDAAPAAARSAAERKPTHRHVKSGRLERVIGEAEAQVSTGDYRPDWTVERRVADGDSLTVYEGADGKLWVRFSDEFNDGRFVALPGEEA